MRQCREAGTVTEIEGTEKKIESQGLRRPYVQTRSQAKALSVDGDDGSVRTIPTHINTGGHYGPWPKDGLVNMTK